MLITGIVYEGSFVVVGVIYNGGADCIDLEGVVEWTHCGGQET